MSDDDDYESHPVLQQLFDPSWIEGFDVERWNELGRRNANEGLTEAEVEELLVMRDQYQTAMKSGEHPLGIRAEAKFTDIRRKPH